MILGLHLRTLAGLALVSPPLLLPHLFPIWVLVLCAGIIAALEYDKGIFSTGYTWARLDTFLMLFVFAATLGVLVSPASDLTLPKATGLLLGVATLRAGIRVVTDVRVFALGLLLISALGVLAVLAGAAILAEPLGFTRIVGQELLVESAVVPQGRVLSPNALAMTVILVLPLLVVQALGGTAVGAAWPNAGMAEAITRALTGGIVVAAVAILSLTHSWNGIAAVVFLTIVSASLYAGAGRLHQRLGVAFGLALAAWIAVMVAVVVVPGVCASALPYANEQLDICESVNSRRELWARAGTAILHFPVTGIGLGATPRVLEVVYPLLESSSSTSAHAHNQWLQVALDLGLPGLLTYLIMQFELMAIGLACIRRTRGWTSAIAIGLFASTVSVHVFGVVDALALGAKVGWFPWATSGLLVGLARVVNSDHVQE